MNPRNSCASVPPTFYSLYRLCPTSYEIYQKVDVIVKPTPGFQRVATCLKFSLPPVGSNRRAACTHSIHIYRTTHAHGLGERT